MAWQESTTRPFYYPMWVNGETHYILKVARFYLLFESKKKGIQSRHESLADAQAAAS